MILAIKTDQPEATIAVVVDGKVLNQKVWMAHRTLARDILKVIHDELETAGGSIKTLKGIIVFKGPGSFTGLRIGAAVANTLAYELKIPIVGTKGENWLNAGIQQVAKGKNDQLILPEYGAEANITKHKK